MPLCIEDPEPSCRLGEVKLILLSSQTGPYKINEPVGKVSVGNVSVEKVTEPCCNLRGSIVH